MEVEFEGPVGRLEGLYETPEAAAPLGAAVVAHPHPLHGGTMRNTVVHRVARALRDCGVVTLRFNFRGVEGSAGSHDGEGAEDDDARAALDFLAARHPDLEPWGAGYSFGARTLCRLAARDVRIRRLVLVALPLAVYPCRCVGELRPPALILFAGADPLGSSAELDARHPALPEGIEVDEIAGADHLFRGRTPLVEERVRAWAQHQLSRSP